MQQKIIWFILFLVSISLVFYWNVIRDADKMMMDELEYNDELLSGDVNMTTEIYRRLENKWLGSSQHIQNLQDVFKKLNKKLKQEIKSTKDRFQDVEGDLAEQARKQNLKNKEIEETIDNEVDDLNTKVRIVKKDLKKIQRNEIEPLKTNMKLVKVNEEKLKQILELDIIKKAIEKSK